MNKEELLKFIFRSFFVVTTGIVVSMYVFCVIFNPTATFSLDEIGRILLMAVMSEIPHVIFYSQKELSKKEMFIRMIIHFPILLAILLYLAHIWDWFNLNSPKETGAMIFLILGVYVIVFVTTTYNDKKLADKLNESLKQRYH